MKKAIFGNFLDNKEDFLSAQIYWRDLIGDSLKSNNVSLLELENKIMFDIDGNPIYYQHFPSLNKSIRIIQERVMPNKTPHLGAWIETVNDFRYYDELVISIELTSETTVCVKKIIDIWFSSKLELNLQDKIINEILDKQISRYRKNDFDGPTF